MTGQRGNQAHRCLGGRCGGSSRIGACTGTSASSRGGSCMASCASRHSCAGWARATRAARLPARLLQCQCGASHVHSHLCDLPVGSSCGGMGVHHVGGPDGGGRATPTAQTCSWRMTAEHGRPAGPPPGLVTAAVAGHAHLPACGAPSSVGTASCAAVSLRRVSADPGGTCGPAFGTTGRWWAGI